MPEDTPVIYSVDEIAKLRREYDLLLVAIDDNAKAILASSDPVAREKARRIIEEVRAIRRIEEGLR
jgi:phosphate uptake regulator